MWKQHVNEQPSSLHYGEACVCFLLFIPVAAEDHVPQGTGGGESGGKLPLSFAASA